MKYIVKNCPALLISGICNGRNVKGLACKNATDCLIKQVIEKCKKKKEWFSKLPDGVAFDLTTLLGSNLQDEILQLFETEECDDEVS